MENDEGKDFFFGWASLHRWQTCVLARRHGPKICIVSTNRAAFPELLRRGGRGGP